MGLLRLLLAVSIILTHSFPLFGYKELDGIRAVEGFFVISGFYMALILNEKYTGKNRSYFLYLSNRLVRIYPVYWLISHSIGFSGGPMGLKWWQPLTPCFPVSP